MSIFGSTRRPPRWKPVVGTPINGGHPLVRQMVLCLLCNEGAGKILKNSVFPVVDGTLSNPAWRPGYWGMGMQSSAVNIDPTINSHSFFDGLLQSGTPTTLLFWALSLNGITNFWTKYQSDQSTIVWQVNTNAGGLQISLFSTNGGRFTPIGTFNNDGKWHQYAFVYDGIADWKTLSSYQFYQDGVPLAMSSSQNNPQNPQRSDAGGNILSVSTSAVWDHLLAWKGRALTASDIRDLYVNPFSFMYVNQRSRILEAAAGVKTQRKPFVFTVT